METIQNEASSLLTQPTAVWMPFGASDANILFKYFIFHPQDTKKQVFKVNWVFFHKLECESP